MSSKPYSPSRKAISIGLFASATEAYNSCIYYFLAPFLAPMLFPTASSTQAQFFSYALTVVAPFIAYPLGSMYYGTRGDRFGRIAACTSSSAGLAMATGLMGLIPLTGVLGSYAWVAFMLCLGLSRFFSAGEYYSSIIFSLEHGKQKQQGALSGLSCLAAVAGLTLCSGLSTWAGVNEFVTLSWRWLFALGFLGGLASYSFKYTCSETPAFTQLHRDPDQPMEPILRFLRRQIKPVLAVAILAGCFGSLYSFLFYFLSNQAEVLDPTYHAFLAMGVYGASLLAAGLLSQKFTPRRVMSVGAAGILITSVFLLNHHDTKALLEAKYILIAFSGVIFGPLHAWVLNRFEPAERCRGIICGFGLGTAFFDGASTPICFYLYDQGCNFLQSSIYPLVLTAAALVTLFLSSEAKSEKAG